MDKANDLDLASAVGNTDDDATAAAAANIVVVDAAAAAVGEGGGGGGEFVTIVPQVGMTFMWFSNDYPTSIGIVRGAVSVATIVVVGAEGRHLSCNKVFVSLMQRQNASTGVGIVGGKKTLLQLITKYTLATLVG